MAAIETRPVKTDMPVFTIIQNKYGDKKIGNGIKK